MATNRKVIIPKAGLRPGHPPYSPAVRWEKLLFCSGQTGSHPITQEFSPDVREQTRVALNRLKELAEAGGASLESAVSVMVHLTDIQNDFKSMNEVFREYFSKDPPSRTTVGVASLARPGLKVEISMIAIVND